MQPKAVLIASLAIGLVSAQDYLDFDQGDFPPACADPCAQVATASDTCDNQFDDDDQGQLNCICTTQNMDSLVPDCLSCLAPFRNRDDDDYGEEYQDVFDLVNACNFDMPSRPSGSLSSNVYTTTRTTTEDDGDVETDTDEVTSFITGSPTGGAASPTTNTVTTTDDNGSSTVLTTTSSPSPTNGDSAQSASSSTPNAAAITAAPLMGAAAGIMAAMIAL